MSRNYGYVGRRSGGGAWQWAIIGMVLGFGCSVMLVLGGLAFGFLTIDTATIANLPTSTPQIVIITATPPPVTPTDPPPPASATPTQGLLLDIAPPTPTATLNALVLTQAALLVQPTQPPVGGFTLPGATIPPLGAGAGVAPGGFDALRARASETVLVEGGTFTMGTNIAEVAQAVRECLAGYGGDPGNCQPEYGEDSAPEHQVTLSAFNMERTEVSYAQFLAFLNLMGPGSHRNGCSGQPCAQTRSDSETSNVTFDSQTYSVALTINDHPMTNVTWYGAQAYCQAIGRRLPTEAEWERAARGRDGKIFPWGNAWDASRASTRRPASGQPQKVPVFAFTTGASDFGVLNMAGNVAEWVSDWYDARFYGRPEATAPDTRGPLSGTTKVVRGGSWDAVPFFSRTVHRQDRDPLQPTAWIGFRCVEDIGANPVALTTTGTTPLGATTGSFSQSDLLLPQTPPAVAGSNEEQSSSAPSFPPAPTLASGG